MLVTGGDNRPISANLACLGQTATVKCGDGMEQFLDGGTPGRGLLVGKRQRHKLKNGIYGSQGSEVILQARSAMACKEGAVRPDRAFFTLRLCTLADFLAVLFQ